MPVNETCPVCHGEGVIPSDKREVWRKVRLSDGLHLQKIIGEDANGNKPCPSCFPDSEWVKKEREKWEQFKKELEDES